MSDSNVPSFTRWDTFIHEIHSLINEITQIKLFVSFSCVRYNAVATLSFTKLNVMVLFLSVFVGFFLLSDEI